MNITADTLNNPAAMQQFANAQAGLSSVKECRCNEMEIQRYKNRLSTYLKLMS